MNFCLNFPDQVVIVDCQLQSAGKSSSSIIAHFPSGFMREDTDFIICKQRPDVSQRVLGLQFPNHLTYHAANHVNLKPVSSNISYICTRYI